MRDMDSRQNMFDKMLCFDIYAANLAFGRLYKPMLDELSLTYPQLLVLLCLWAEDGRSVGGLGLALSLDSSTLTPMLKRLETQGFVIRKRDHEDERRVIVTLTDKGRDLQAPAVDVLQCTARGVGFDEDERARLHDMLLRLRQNLTAAAAAG
jgi:MarR family transcriptional regulator, organic hydroperoxide resistance regulator